MASSLRWPRWPLVPVQVIDPESQRLLTDARSSRRQFIDWVVFHVEPPYLEALAALSASAQAAQRNALLRKGAAGAMLVHGTRS